MADQLIQRGYIKAPLNQSVLNYFPSKPASYKPPAKIEITPSQYEHKNRFRLLLELLKMQFVYQSYLKVRWLVHHHNFHQYIAGLIGLLSPNLHLQTNGG